MVERGRSLRLDPEAIAGALVGARARREELEGNPPPERGVPSAVDDAHPAAADQLAQLVPAHGRTGGLRRRTGGRSEAYEGAVEGTGRLVRGEQRLDLPPQGLVSRAGAFEELRPLHRRELERLEQQRACGGVPDRPHVPSSRCNHARATVHSRFTVAGEIWRASAVSSMLIPAK